MRHGWPALSLVRSVSPLERQTAEPGGMREFWLDFDFRVGKRAGIPAFALGAGHPIPCWLPLKKPKEKDAK
jgi:hypothetical protein